MALVHKISVLAVLSLSLTCFMVSAQTGMGSKIGISIHGSTSGLGADLFWRMNDRWSLHAGYTMAAFRFDINLDQSALSLDASMKYNCHSVMVGANYRIVDGLYAVANCGLLTFEPSCRITPRENVRYGDISLDPQTVGNGEVEIINRVKFAPYLGLGYSTGERRDTRMKFFVQIGGYWIGSPRVKINATGMLSPSNSAQHEQSLSQLITKYKIIPELKLGVAIRIGKCENRFKP